VVEYEEHTMAEIDEGRTLAEVGELNRWEQMGKKGEKHDG
jgi:hypothetical protein